MINKKNTALIVESWRNFLKEDYINEISFKALRNLHPNFDYDSLSEKLKSNHVYLDIVKNSLNRGENHSAHDYNSQFEYFKRTIERNINDDDFLQVDVPGSLETFTLKGKLDLGNITATYEDIQQFQQARLEAGKGSNKRLTQAYIRVLEQLSENDFEVILNDSEWLICYPKTQPGSIAIARSYWDGSNLVYDETFSPSTGFGQRTGWMQWCTSVSGSGNMFNNYHKRFNMHMYYCIKKNISSIKDINRKLCLSFTKPSGTSKRGKSKNSITLSTKSNSTVNANNSSISESKVLSIISKERLDYLYQDVEKSSRKKVDYESYYRAIDVNQYIVLRNANEDNIEDFMPELRFILQYSKDKAKILDLCLTDKSIEIKKVAAGSNISEEQILILANDENEEVRALIACKWETPANILEILSEDPEVSVRVSVASNSSYNITPEILEKLSKDESEIIISAVAYNRKSSASLLSRIFDENKLRGTKIRCLNNDNFPIDKFANIFREKMTTLEIKLDMIWKGSTNQVLSKEEIIEFFYELKEKGMLDIEARKNFFVCGYEEILLDSINFCKNESKVNKDQKRNFYSLMLNYDEELSENVVIELYKVSDSGMLSRIASKQNTPEYILREIANLPGNRGNNMTARKSVINNPNTPVDVLQMLADTDASSYNRKFARKNLEKRKKLESNLRDYIRLIMS